MPKRVSTKRVFSVKHRNNVHSAALQNTLFAQIFEPSPGLLYESEGLLVHQPSKALRNSFLLKKHQSLNDRTSPTDDSPWFVDKSGLKPSLDVRVQ